MEDLCSTCLCTGRNLYFLEATKSYEVYSQIMTEIPVYDLSQISVRVCWECKALLRRFELFKNQVKSSYHKLIEFVYQKHPKSSPTVPSHLQIYKLHSINYPEVDIKMERYTDSFVEVKTEVEDVEHNEPETFVNNLDLETMRKKDLVKKPKEKAKKNVKEKTKKKVKEKKNRSVKKKGKKEKESFVDYSDADNDADYVEPCLEDNQDEISVDKDVLKEECKKIEVESAPKEAKKAIKVNGVAVQNKVEKEKLPERPQCVECGKMFSSRKTYRYHRNVLHKGQNRYPCPRCGKVYQWKSNLGRHMRSHKALDSGELYCALCDKRFASVATYKQHLRISRRHVAETDFSFVCNECGKKFVNKTRLRDHIDWEHLKKIKFKCQLCNKPFKCHTSLYVHLQNVHKNKEKKDNLCHVCGKSYQNSAKLKYHIIAMHTSETPYQCAHCAAAFGWYSSLYRHVREVHYKVKLQPKKAKKGKKTEALPSMLPEPIVLPHLHLPGTS